MGEAENTNNNETQNKSFLSNKAYDTLKTIAAILPLLGAFYYGLSEIWGIPYGGPVQATFALLSTTLSAILIKLSHDYGKWHKLIETQPSILDNIPLPENNNIEHEPEVEEPVAETTEEVTEDNTTE
jgi:hypothetical protein